ncbi:hypothetical protein TIFTF001_027549 [Ficus carica]|uniref:Myb/SANT-like domain-containing protein n=1 Tax=Ficus carica TaxID=3494 RepID=A0AA88DN93_FICCA|nr:hypothetical protein TIFTF001_027549 [Ficus carica]
MQQDDALVDALLELSQNAMWRADCGFKNGYLLQLEAMMEAKLPDYGIKASPHIGSRVKWFKQKYCAMTNMLSLSMDNDKMNRKDAASLYGKPFPHYYTLGEIYGRDRATGINAGNADDDEEDVCQQDTMNENLVDDSNMAFKENSIENEMFYTQQPSVQPNQPVESSPNVSTCKDVAGLQAHWYEEIMKIEGLDDYQLYDATNILATNHGMLRVFYSVPEQLKNGYILKVLSSGA